MDKNQLVELVYDGNYEAAYSLTKDYTPHDIYMLLSDKAYEENDINFYGFFVHLLMNRPKSDVAEIHHSASVILGFNMCQIQGAYDLAEYHIREALKLNPENEDYKRYLKHLRSVPR